MKGNITQKPEAAAQRRGGSMAFEYRITVFTPTYNRGYILGNLYASLQRQAFTDFEWLIVDDGSQDDTQALVEGWMRRRHAFAIRYVKQENGGKCRAINRGLDLARGELFFVMDSDDILSDDALVKVDRWFSRLPKDGRLMGVGANCGYAPDKTPNALFDEPYRDMTLLEKYSLPSGENAVGNGERALIFYTDFHRQYRYPEFEGENFMTEAVTWNRMAHDGFTMRFFNDIIWIYEYQADGLTRAGMEIFFRNPRGYGLYMREKMAFLRWPFLKRLRECYSFACNLEGRYPASMIAECIGTNTPLICACHMLHHVYGGIKRMRRIGGKQG